jgi:hypothetical protein
MMMMVVMVVRMFGCVTSTFFFVTVFKRSFTFYRGVRYAVFLHFFLDCFFNLLKIAVGYNVQGCAVVKSVHTPHVQMMKV